MECLGESKILAKKYNFWATMKGLGENLAKNIILGNHGIFGRK